jgi:hypothetical protein
VNRDGDSDDGDREQQGRPELGEHSADQGPKPPQHSAVGPAGENAPAGIDLVEDDRDCCGRDDRCEQPANAADQHGQEGGHGTVPAVERDQGATLETWKITHWIAAATR